MADEKTCRFCTKNILDKKSYRSLHSYTLREQFVTVVESFNIRAEGFVCMPCFNKLNRLSNLEDDINKKLEVMRTEGQKLAAELQSMPGVECKSPSMSPILTTPRGVKRPLTRTPTPNLAKRKSKRSLFVTPKKKVNAPEKADKSTQTKSFTEDFSVKITVKYAGKERSRIIHDKLEQNIVKAIFNLKPERALKYQKKGVVKQVCKDIKLELRNLLKNSEKLFRVTASRMQIPMDLCEFDWATVAEDFQKKAPILFEILQTVLYTKVSSQKLPQLITAASILLYSRNNKLSMVQYILGLVLDQCGLSKEGMKIAHELGLTVSPTSIHRKKRQLTKIHEIRLNETVKKYVEKREGKLVGEISDAVKPIEMLGDNFDITITPARMTIDRQRRSFHWFLTMVKQKQVTIDDLHIPEDDLPSSPNILEMPTSSWIPTTRQVDALTNDLSHHVAQVLKKYIDFLKPFKITDYIPHEYIHKTKQKSVILNCDLVDASENSSEGMIRILQEVQELAVPHTEQKVLEKIVFGGDVLTNERAFSAQEAMQNNVSEYDCLQGLIHRPEGLHREMNFLLVYQGVQQLESYYFSVKF